MSMKAKAHRGRIAHFLQNLHAVTVRPGLKLAKLKYLIDKIKDIPPIHHYFFQNLTHTLSTTQDVSEEGILEDVNEVFELETLYDTD